MFKPKFTITPKINNKIAEIEKLKTIFDQATIIPELAIELRFRATVESVHSSTSIEGNPLNQLEVKKVLEGSNISAPDYAIQEILNYKNALNLINREKVTQNILDSNKILKLHNILMKDLLPSNKVGSYRLGDVYIVDEINSKEVVQYVGPQAIVLEKLVSSFTRWTEIQRKERELHPALLAGIIHFIFVSIHPFSDGNGRTTRLLTHQFLKSSSYDFNDSLSLDSFYLQNKERYYQALSRGKTFEDRMFADITPFLDFFVEGFLQSVKTLTKYVQIGDVLDENNKPIRLNQKELLILDYVYQFKSISIKEAIVVTQATKRTTQRRLSKLVENKIMRIEGRGPSTTYKLIN
ncbi:MAG: Fic family protein [Candidatus Pacebacteria bacterium]|nr:Fic family protein [Candidatus Paceibacterota bacterium]MBT3512076.1 Fic family protein [Candidatus Paceibacterota bacterium]MBT4005204.1 Fic family protein [Candidatus Paceibacterota bacterium]MBT4358636.1 Fic family protein [Candidatus Paceibacterota bacterium]MBT4680663.1 Fic family protein [Candidatus Paceibacterota bacterium]